jgi:hypothetical protein
MYVGRGFLGRCWRLRELKFLVSEQSLADETGLLRSFLDPSLSAAYSPGTAVVVQMHRRRSLDPTFNGVAAPLVSRPHCDRHDLEVRWILLCWITVYYVWIYCASPLDVRL